MPTLVATSTPEAIHMRILFCSNPSGLGHAARDVAIGFALREGSDLIYLSGGVAAQLIRDSGFRVHDEYPSPVVLAKEDRVTMTPWRFFSTYFAWQRRCEVIARRIVSEVKPSLIIADEDLAAAKIARELGTPYVYVTDFLRLQRSESSPSIDRHVVGWKFVSLIWNRWLSNCYGHAVTVIVCRAGKSDSRFLYAGRVVRRIDHSREELRNLLEFKRRTVLLTVGGTELGRFLINETIDAMRKINDQTMELIIITGPSIDPSPYRESWRAQGYVPNLHEYIYAADLVVSLAGRSTIDEAESYGTPIIAIPLRNHSEQETNAAELGFNSSDRYRLVQLISKCIKAPRRVPDFSHLPAVASQIRTAVSEVSR